MTRPEWSDLERHGHAGEVWERARETFHSEVMGPHFEQLCRVWARWHAAPGTLGGRRTRVAAGTVPDPAARTSHEVDVAAFGPDGVGGHERLLAVGEAKWNGVVGVDHLRRLERILDLLRARDLVDARATRLLCFSGGGFSAELRGLAARSAEIQLVDLDRLYHGA